MAKPATRHYCEFLQVRFTKVIAFTQCLNIGNNNSAKFRRNIEKLKTQNTYTGEVKKGSKKRITKAVDLLLQLSPLTKVYNPITNKYQKFRLTFITLTIPLQSAKMDVNYLYKSSLKPFLRWISEVKKANTYVYKLEFQKNGSPHYHITTNKFIRYDELKSKWNLLLQAAGILDEHKFKFGNYNPNSTDIHQVFALKNIEAYLCKYLSKNDNLDGTYKGKIWGCSDNLKGQKMYTTEINRFNNLIIRRATEDGLIEVFQGKNFAIFKPTNDSILNLLDNTQLTEYKQHLKQLKNGA